MGKMESDDWLSLHGDVVYDLNNTYIEEWDTERRQGLFFGGRVEHTCFWSKTYAWMRLDFRISW